MNTTDDDKDSLAALYTLGALSEAERQEADQRHKTDPQWQLLLAKWQQRLDPLTQLVDPVAPAASVAPVAAAVVRALRACARPPPFARLACGSGSRSRRRGLTRARAPPLPQRAATPRRSVGSGRPS